MEQLDLFKDRFTIKMSLFAYRNWATLNELWVNNPELCEDDIKRRMHKQELMWKQYAYMAGCNPIQLVMHAVSNGHISS